jgi:methionine-rich copper-binding protein CopC
MAATVLVVATAFGSPGIARAGLVSSTPEANATVTQGAAVGPQINLHFSEKIDLSRSTFAVIGPRGRMMTTVGQDVNDKTVVFVSLWNQVLSGKYTIRWQTVSTGRQRSHGSFTFTVKLGR